MLLADHYAFGGTDHFDPEKVMKIPQILHVERCRQLQLHAVDFAEVAAPGILLRYLLEPPSASDRFPFPLLRGIP